jgi:hypothetical protein
MPNTRKLRKQRLRLWQADPHCFWCGVRTILPSKQWKGPVSPNVATIDHLRPRHHPGRLIPANGEIRRVLSCWKCNNDRDQFESSLLPKEWFYEHGCTRPLTERTLDELQRIEALLLSKEPSRKRDRERIHASVEAVRDAIQTKLVTA